MSKFNLTKKIYLGTAIAFFAAFILIGFIGFFAVYNLISAEREQTERIIVEHSSILNEAISRQLYKTQALTALVINGDGTVENFQEIAAVIATDLPALAAFLLAPDGVVVDAYPLEDNPTVVGLDLLDVDDHAGNREAIIARDTGSLVMGGPFVLRSGIMGLTGRYPVYITSETGESEFWGLVAVSLKYPQALEEAGLSMLEMKGFSYELWRIDPDTQEKQIIANSGENSDYSTNYIERSITIHHAEWNLRIYPIRHWYQFSETWLLVLGAISISLFVAFVVQAKTVSDYKAARDKEATKAKSKFLAFMSHEIRSPMNVIIGISENELENANHTPEVLDAFEKINSSGKTLLGIVNEVLDLSKIEKGTLDIIPVKYCTACLISDTISLNTMLIGDKNIEIVVNVSEALPAALIGDDIRIKQILNNILSNSIKYTEAGTIIFKADTKEIDDRTYLIFTVKDTGQGLSKEELKEIYNEYSMFNQESNRKVEGSGLGMNITKRLVEAMDGRIDADSKPGVGSTFTVHIPQQTFDAPVIGKKTAQDLGSYKTIVKKVRKTLSRKYIPHGRVLIVDDIEANIFVAAELMKPYGFIPESAKSGYEVIEKIENGSSYDIIFMDYMMAGINGIATAKILHEKGYNKPIVALTAVTVAGMKDTFIESGFDGVLSKPINIYELDDILNKYIGEKKPQNQAKIMKLKEIAALNTEAALAAVSGLSDVYIDTVKLVLQILPERIENLSKFIDNDMPSFALETHGLKSVLANIGAIRLGITAADMERAALDGDAVFCKERLPDFKENLILLKNDLDVALRADDLETKIKADKPFSLEKLNEIKTATEEYDSLLALDFITPELRYSYDKDTDEILLKIASALEASDYDRATENIHRLEGMLNG